MDICERGSRVEVMSCLCHCCRFRALAAQRCRLSDTGSSHLLAEAHLSAAPTLPLAQEFPALQTTGAAGGAASLKASPCSPEAHGAPHPFLASCQQEGAAREPSLLLVPL